MPVRLEHISYPRQCLFVFIACTEYIEPAARTEYDKKRSEMLDLNTDSAPIYSYVNVSVPAIQLSIKELYKYILDQPQYDTVMACLKDQNLLNKNKDGYAAVAELFGAISEEIHSFVPPKTVTGTTTVIHIPLTVLNRREACAARCLLQAAAYDVVISTFTSSLVAEDAIE